MQRKCDRLEARRAAEKAMAAQHLEALRSSGREEKQSQELAELERRTTEKERREAILQAYLNRKEVSLDSLIGQKRQLQTVSSPITESVQFVRYSDCVFCA